MSRSRTRRLALVALVGASLGAAPATPSYQAVEARIARVRAGWEVPNRPADPNAPGWNSFFDALRADLTAYGRAETEDRRLAALGRIHRKSLVLRGVAWQPAVELKAALDAWLAPRVTLAWAQRRLTDTIRALPPSDNRERWLRFVDAELGAAARAYEGADLVRARVAALGRLQGALRALSASNQAAPWAPALGFQGALQAVYNQQNLDASADVATLQPLLAKPVVQSGPVTREGQTAYVTAGPYLGFSLLPSDQGIAFTNQQMAYSTAPIRGFQEQVARDPKGRRAAKLYQFGATSTNNSVVTITALLTPNGLNLFPAAVNNISASISSAPQPGKGFGRAIAALLGFNQNRITQQVYQGAIGQIVQGVVRGSQAEAGERSAAAQAEQNARLARNLIGGNNLVANNVLVTGLSLRSRPQFALIGGNVQWLGAADQRGADLPEPAQFAAVGPGVTADVHLASVLANMTRGYLQSPAAANVRNLMIVTRKIPPNAPPQQGLQVSQNVDFATFSKAVDTARVANDPKVLAVRIRRPGHSPDFAADRDGYLAVVLRDIAIEVPAPAQNPGGGLFAGPKARIYRLEFAEAEFRISFKVSPATAGGPLRLSGRIEAFDPGPNVAVFGLDEDEAKANRLNAFTSNIIANVFANRLKGQPIDVPLGGVNLPGFALASVSPLDPSGWIRFVLTPVPRVPTGFAAR